MVVAVVRWQWVLVLKQFLTIWQGVAVQWWRCWGEFLHVLLRLILAGSWKHWLQNKLVHSPSVLVTIPSIKASIYLFLASPREMFLHTQSYGLSPLWICICCFKSLFYESFSPVWVYICFFKGSFSENCAAHFLEMYSFSPVWVCTCIFRLLFSDNNFPHLYCLPPVWLGICWFRVLFCKVLLHTLNNGMGFPQCGCAHVS